jgi:long-subunit acyl-CoA synthetase (AMP-forming)
MVRGYYKNPEATAAMLDNEGYYRTGEAPIFQDIYIYIIYIYIVLASY